MYAAGNCEAGTWDASIMHGNFLCKELYRAINVTKSSKRPLTTVGTTQYSLSRWFTAVVHETIVDLSTCTSVPARTVPTSRLSEFIGSILV